MINISKEVVGAKTIGITGHIRPDGDCIGSCLAMASYLRKNCPDAKVEVFLEAIPTIFYCLEGSDDIRTDFKTEVEQFDVFMILDTDNSRIGDAKPYFDNAKKKINIDHHITNKGVGDVNYIDADASSACELVYDVLDKDKIDVEIAKSIYVGMINDNGIFQYSSTSPKTLRTAADLISYGFDFSELIHKTFHEKTYVQNQLIGRSLLESVLILDGKCIFSVIDRKTMRFYDASPKHFDGIVNQLGNTRGVEVAIFMYELAPLQYKVSLRSQGHVDVAEIAAKFGGGGHKRAAGCTMNGTYRDAVNNLSADIEKQLKEDRHV